MKKRVVNRMRAIVIWRRLIPVEHPAMERLVLIV